MKTSSSGFTLIELLVTVAVIGILCVIIVPKFADLSNKARESETKGHLGAIRSALNMYYSDYTTYPRWNDNDVHSTVPKVIRVLAHYRKYLSQERVEAYRGEHHVKQAGGVEAPLSNMEGSGVEAAGWIYGSEDGPEFEQGRFFVNCTHTDSKGHVWSSY